MIFSSPSFLFLFLPIVLGLYTLTPRALKNSLLLFASLFFYAWGEGFYVLIMLLSIGMNYVSGHFIVAARSRHAGRWTLAASITCNLLFLGFFKYADFVVDNLNLALAAIGIPPVQVDPIHLPIGISFFTFQAISYVVDVYRRESAPQRSILDLGLYISLFPQLIAGPIVRYHDVAEQIRSRAVSSELFASGVRRFVMGLGKKTLIANPLGEVADGIFGLGIDELAPGAAWLGLICYTFQIYFDFSAYSDMAIGLGRMFGFRFLENFDHPYTARSLREFWRRWHISLSTWFRDYLYIPLGGNRRRPGRVYLNLCIVFFLCGLWHGASWNFIFWGLLHGCFLVLERTRVGGLLQSLWSPLRRIYTLAVVMLGWVFFRCEDIWTAFRYLARLLGSGEPAASSVGITGYLDNATLLILCLAAFGSSALFPRLRRSVDQWISAAPGSRTVLLTSHILEAASMLFLALVFLLSAIHLAADTYNPFIYFRF